jgi:nitroimidazol reductase NimA-like FMN-containing flavoprotein (pyridoxamine 5'-phosphate oxidase superfamily)
MTETASLEVLTDEVCRFLLTTEEVGRVAFLDADDYPVVLPVNYFLDRDFVVFRTAPGTKLREIPLARVAFEVDHLAPANRSGWSVLVQGHGEDVTNAVDPSHATLREANVEPWAPGDKERWVAIQIHRITGRRIVRSQPLE